MKYESACHRKYEENLAKAGQTNIGDFLFQVFCLVFILIPAGCLAICTIPIFLMWLITEIPILLI